MGFQFGLVSTLSSLNVHVCFLAVVVLILAFDFLTGFLMFAVRDSKELSLLLHHIFKELMLMGIVSFTIIMIESNPSDNNASTHDVLLSVDFCHIVLFYLVIFFVLHIFLMMSLSVYIDHKFFKAQSVTDEKLAVALHPIVTTTSKLKSTLISFFPTLYQLFGSDAIFTTEFKILKTIFTNTYFMPSSLDFARYMSVSLVKYSLETFERSTFSWLILITLCVLDWLRVDYNWGMNCGPVNEVAHLPGVNSEPSHRLLVEKVLVMPHTCYDKHLTFFLYLGFILAAYSLGLLLISRQYFSRLIKKSGIEKIHQYKLFVDFLSYCNNRKMVGFTKDIEAAKDIGSIDSLFREYTFADLMKILAEELYEYEDEAETVFYKSITTSFRICIDSIHLVLHKIYIFMVLHIFTCFKSNKVIPQVGRSSVLARSRSVTGIVDTSKKNDDGKVDDPTSRNGLKRRVTQWRRDVKSFVNDDDYDENSNNVENKGIRKASVLEAFNEGDEENGGDKDGSATRSAESSAMKDSFLGTHAFSKPFKVSIKSSHSILSANNSGEYVVDKGVLTCLEFFKMKMYLNNLHASRRIPEEILKRTNPAQLVDMLSYESLSHVDEFLRLIKDIENTLHKVEKSHEGASFGKKLYLSLRRFVDYCFGKPTLEHLKIEPWQLSQNFNDIYIFSNPNLYHKCIEAAVTLNCAYLAMWACNFITIVNSHFKSEGILWQILLIIPILINVPCIALTTISGSMMKAVGDFDTELLLNTIKEMDLTEDVRNNVRRKLHSTLVVKNSSTKKETLEKLFADMDEDGSGEINKIEFRSLLRQIYIKLDDANFSRLWRSMDLEGNGSIDIDEFLILLLHDHVENLHMAQDRLDSSIWSRVKTKLGAVSHMASYKEKRQSNRKQ